MNKTSLIAKVRDKAGKGASRLDRRNGATPAVIYGNGEKPIMINLEPKLIMIELQKPGFKTRVFELDVNGKKENCICQNIQFHPVKDIPLHLDFLRISDKRAIKVAVPVKFENREKNACLKQGGTLNQIIRTVKIVCDSKNIINEIIVDLTSYNANDAIKLFDLKLPEGVKLYNPKTNFTIANLLPSRVAKMEETAATGDKKAAPVKKK